MFSQVLGLLFGSERTDANMERRLRRHAAGDYERIGKIKGGANDDKMYKNGKLLKDKKNGTLGNSVNNDDDIGRRRTSTRLTVAVDDSSVDSDSSKATPSKKRGRPKSGPLKKKVVISPAVSPKVAMKRFHSTSTLSSIDDSNSEGYDSEGYPHLKYGSIYGSATARRSRRSRPLDPTKELVVILPKHDPTDKVDISAHEVDEFNSAMEEVLELDLADEGTNDEHNLLDNTNHDEALAHEGMEVFIPAVVDISKENRKKFSKILPSNIKLDNKYKLPTMGHVINGSKYNDYEADSDDEEFLISITKLAKRTTSASAFSVTVFESMIAALERELETSKILLPSILETEDHRALCQNSLDMSNKVLSLANSYIKSNDNKLVKQIQNVAGESDKNSGENSLLGTLRRSSSHNSLSGTDHTKHEDTASNGYGRAAATTAAVAVAFLCGNSISKADLTNTESREYKTYFGVSRPSLETDPFLFPYYSVDQLKKLVTKERVNIILRGIVAENSEIDNAEMNYLITQVYNYWLQKRSRRRVSLLRCYHNFIMDNWQQMDSLPRLVEDTDSKQLEQSRNVLLKLRRDLDRARLIVDRVRRRERLKRDIIRINNEYNNDDSGVNPNFSYQLEELSVEEVAPSVVPGYNNSRTKKRIVKSKKQKIDIVSSSDEEDLINDDDDDEEEEEEEDEDNEEDDDDEDDDDEDDDDEVLRKSNRVSTKNKMATKSAVAYKSKKGNVVKNTNTSPPRRGRPPSSHTSGNRRPTPTIGNDNKSRDGNGRYVKGRKLAIQTSSNKIARCSLLSLRNDTKPIRVKKYNKRKWDNLPRRKSERHHN